MKKILINLFFIGLLLLPFFLFTAFKMVEPSYREVSRSYTTDPGSDDLRQAAFEVLKAKCNVCHKKKNPFKIFSLKNMDKHAPRIYKQVFVYRRMPKGNQVQLTEEEYQTLKNWLKSKNIF